MLSINPSPIPLSSFACLHSLLSTVPTLLEFHTHRLQGKNTKVTTQSIRKDILFYCLYLPSFRYIL